MVENKIYPLSGINNDDDLRVIAQNDYLNLQNGRVAISEFGKAARIENVPGTTLVTQNVLPPYGTNFCIGSCVDRSRNYLIYALYNTFGDNGIYAYDPATGTTYAVIYDSQVIGGLNFSKSYRIDRNMYVIGDLLYWTDNYNEPKNINYIAGIKANQSSYVTDVKPYSFPIKYQSSTLIVRPPIYVPTVTKQTDSGFLNNFTANNAYLFTYQYVFRDYQTSALAGYSQLVPYNFKTDTFNSILVKIPFAEKIDNEIQIVNLCVKYGNNGKTFIVRSWNKDNQQDADLIFSHNLGLVQLQYTFYDNVVGVALDDVSSITEFSNVPLTTKTLLPARDRMFLGNNKMGYSTPAITSLGVSAGTSGSDTRIFKSGGLYKVSIQFMDRFKRKCGAVDISIPINVADRTFTQTTFTNLINWTLSNTNALNEIPDWAYYYQILYTKNLNKAFYIQGMTQNMYYATKDIDGNYVLENTTFSASATAALAVSLSVLNASGIGYTFTDGDFATLYRYTDVNYTAKVLGVNGNYVLLSPVDVGKLTNNYSFSFAPFSYINVADTAYLPATCNNPIKTVDLIVQSAPAAGLNDDPPELGKVNYIMDNLTFTARNFTASGKLVFNITGTPSTFPNITFSLYFTHPDTTAITIVNFYTQAATAGTYNVTFSGVAANIPAGYNRVSLIGNFPDIVTVDFISGEINLTEAGAQNLIEIYTPNKENINESYYEYGDVLDVTNPTTNSRIYSTLSGSIIGDSYKIARLINGTTTYYPEAMSPNDLEWQLWQRSLGFFNTFDLIGQQQKKDSIAFSDTYINGTKTNGLCSFQPTNQKDIGSDGGQIQKMLLTNKKQEDGTVMLLWTDNNVLSIYLGETQVVASATNTFISTSTGVIGTINALKSNSGTINPESVIDYNGIVWWVDANNGWVSQYASDGVFPVSSFKMSRFFQRYLKNYLAANKNDLDNINGFHYISSMIDPFHKRVMVVLPALIYQNYATILPSYNTTPPYATSIINRLDAYDSLGKTMCYDYIENRWKESFEFLPEWNDTVQDKLYGFKNGKIYIHDSDTTNYNNFYGTNYPVRLALVHNVPPSEVKDVMDISIEGTAAPDYSFAYSPYPNVQISDLTSSDYTNLEGVFYARVLRDRLSPNIVGTVDKKLFSGDVIKSATPLFWFEWQQYSALFYANFINIAVDDSRGQKQLISK